MDKEDIAFQKMALLMKATQKAREQYEEPDEPDDALEELKAAAFEVLLENPGCEQSDWAQILVEQYGTELVDEYGPSPADVFASLADLWESPYYDENSGLEYDYKDWAEALWTEAAVQMYYDLTAKI